MRLIPISRKNVIDRLLSELAKDGFINNYKKKFLSNSLENFKNKIVLRKRNAFYYKKMFNYSDW